MKKLSFFLLCFLLFISSYSQNKPTLSDKNSFSMILLPDPQSYTKFDTNQPIFELMTAWVASVKKNLAVKAVLCTGDLVEQNECLVPDNVNGNQTSEEQWKPPLELLKDWTIDFLTSFAVEITIMVISEPKTDCAISQSIFL